MKRHSLPVCVLLCSVLFMACEHDSVPEELPVYGVHYQLATSNQPTVLGNTPSGVSAATAKTATTVSWRSGSAVARRISFQATGDDEVDIRTAAPGLINLVGVPTNLGMLSIPKGSYTDARFTIELSPTDPFQLTGDFNGTPLVLQITSPISFELDQEELAIADLTNYNAVTTLNLSRVFNGVSSALLSEATLSNGQIVISPASNTRIYNIMLENMKDLAELEFAKR
jgi:hypothetical protein